VALPRRQSLIKQWAWPLVRPLAEATAGIARTGGTALSDFKLNGGAEPRLTSGGIAETEERVSGIAETEECVK
jgi:hypothetical protein